MNKKQEKAEMIKLIGNVKPFYVETIAEALYDAGYRKVLLDTENGKAVDVPQYAPWELIEGHTEREVEKTRKETAIEILNSISRLGSWTNNCDMAWFAETVARKLKDEYEVEK